VPETQNVTVTVFTTFIETNVQTATDYQTRTEVATDYQTRTVIQSYPVTVTTSV
jgi:hypothetical protein